MNDTESQSMIWNSLLSETQYATELTSLGLRTLCQVPLPHELFMTDEQQVRYKLHVGLHAYTSGLERLGKLAYSCQTYLNTGEFPAVKPLSHKLTKISEKIEALDFTSSHNLFPEYLQRPVSANSESFITLLDSFAAGSGRYEYLDSLSSDERGPDSYVQWKELATSLSNKPRVNLLIDLANSLDDVLYSRVDDDQHFLLYGLIDSRPGPFMPGSTAACEILFNHARWFAASLSAASSEAFYGRSLGDTVPYLAEVLNVQFLHDWDSFFEYHIAQFGDAEVLLEGISQIDDGDPANDSDDEL